MKRAERKRQTRARLLEVAADLFAERGVLATRTADIAKAAGVSHGTVFVHFPTREELVAAVISLRAQAVMDRIHEAATGSQGLRAVLEAHLAGLAEHEDFYARLVAESPALPPFARHTLLGIQAAISHHLHQAAEPAMAAGELKTVPMHLLFNTWLGLVHHYLVNRDLFAPGASVLATHGQILIDHTLALLAP